MAVKTRIEPLDSWVSVTVSEMLSPAARSRAVADFARQEFGKAQATNQKALGAEAPFEQFVDGRAGAALETVNPERGRIVFEFELVNDLLLWIHAALVARSPRGPAGGAGTYRDEHRLFADGIEVAIGGAVPPASEYSFMNTVPYARKLEVGRTKSGRDFLVSVPNRIYERTAKDARSRFGNVAAIRFTYRGLAPAARSGPKPGRESGTPARKLRFPTITVSSN